MICFRLVVKDGVIVHESIYANTSATVYESDSLGKTITASVVSAAVEQGCGHALSCHAISYHTLSYHAVEQGCGTCIGSSALVSFSPLPASVASAAVEQGCGACP